MCHFFVQRLKPLMPMDTNLHACGCEVNQNTVTMDAITEVKTSSDILGPKMASESISENQIS